MRDIPLMFKIKFVIPAICIPYEIKKYITTDDTISITYIDVGLSFEEGKITTNTIDGIDASFLDSMIEECDPADYAFAISAMSKTLSADLNILQNKINEETVKQSAIHNLMSDIVESTEEEDDLTEVQKDVLSKGAFEQKENAEYLKHIHDNLMDSLQNIRLKYDTGDYFNPENEELVSEVKQDLEKRIIKTMPNDMFYSLESFPDEAIADAIRIFLREEKENDE